MATFPLTRQVVQSSPDGSFNIDWQVKNITAVGAEKIDLWVQICDGCKYKKEPLGFSRREGADEHIRHHTLDYLNPGVTLEKQTVAVSAPGDAATFDIAFAYACDKCGDVAHQWQTFTIYAVPQEKK